MMFIHNDIKYIGVNDHTIDLFEGQFQVPNGMSYNSYVLFDEKIAVFDSVDEEYVDEWIHNLMIKLDGKNPDYLIISHMEPDHSAGLQELIKLFPNIKVVATLMAFKMYEQFFKTKLLNTLVVKDNDVLNLGKHNLKFITAPNVHWPEVIFTYDEYAKVLFSADAFGKFGALDIEEEWHEEASRYYYGIVGKYGTNVVSALNKLEGLNIDTICSLHGPVLNENLSYYINLYKDWSTYTPDKDGVCIVYTSVYGNTLKAASLLYNDLKENNINVSIYDLQRNDFFDALKDAFRYKNLAIFTQTYNNTLFPQMSLFIDELVLRDFQNKNILILENGTWAPVCDKLIKEKFKDLKNINYLPSIKVLSNMSDINEKEILEFKNNLK